MIVHSGYGKTGFDAFGGTVLRISDMDHWKNTPEMTDPKGVRFELGEDIKEVEAGFFELFPTLHDIRILNPECVIYMTEATEALLHKNDVIIRGRFDTSAEAFAEQYGLRFLHIDEELARAGDYFAYGVDIITIFFYENGDAYINQDSRCQGGSSGSSGGGEIDFDLPHDFYRTMTAEDVAGRCWGSCYGRILEKGVLAGMIKKAKVKNGFLIDYRKRAKSDE